ncbi:MAG: amidohydrolase family protein [Gammaproteobacteria bacterium]
MKTRMLSVLALLLVGVSAARAETVAIVHARAWTMTADTPLDNATIVVTDGKIVSVGAGTAAPAAARVIDAKGQPVTPGLMHSATQLGLLEASGANETVDSRVTTGTLGAGFDIQYAINPNSVLIQLARADGLTRAIAYPGSTAVAPFAGTGVLLHLNESTDLLERTAVGVFVVIGNRSTSAGGSRAAQWKLLRLALDAAKTGLASPASPATRTSEFLALEPVLAGKVPLAVSTNRESDILQSIKLASDYSVKVIIVGGAEAWMAAEQLAKAKIPVLADPQMNLPISFDAIGSRLDNAALLHEAGVTVATNVISGIYQSYNAGLSIREGAGLAVANGLPYIDGLRGLTTVPAQIWGIADRYGTLAAGKDADIVIWDGDPLEPATLAQTVMIQGKEVSLVTRQTQLRDRYLPGTGITLAPGMSGARSAPTAPSVPGAPSAPTAPSAQ